jgi:hypothetical protein
VNEEGRGGGERVTVIKIGKYRWYSFIYAIDMVHMVNERSANIRSLVF